MIMLWPAGIPPHLPKSALLVRLPPQVPNAVDGRTSVPKHRRKTRKPRRALLAICTTAVTTTGTFTFASSVSADPEPSLEEVKKQVDDLYHEAEKAAERHNAAADELEDVERRVDRAESSLEKQQKKFDKALGGIANYAAQTYQSGSMDPTLRTLLADDPDEFLAEISVLDAYATQQDDALQHAAEQKLALGQVRLMADEERARLAEVEEELDDELDHANDKLAEAEELLDGLEADERERLEELERERMAEAEETSRDEERDLPDVEASGMAQAAVDYALAQVGDAYVYGASGPDAFDCSGLTSAAWAAAGVSLSRTSSSQYGDGTPVSSDALQPGDLVFYYSPISHVGIYIGDGQIVHAANPSTGVDIAPVFGYMDYSGAVRPG